MPPQLRMKPVITAALICTLLVMLCIFYVDKPVERIVWSHVVTHGAVYKPLLIFDMLATPSLIPMPAVCAYLLFYALRRLSGRPAGAQTKLYLTLSVATAVANLLKDELKWVFGRPWPSSWVRYGIYKFQPFTDNYLYGGFPSGHTTYIAAPMFVLWWLVPQYRLLWLGIVFMVMVGLVGSGHHFVSDVISGFFLGLAAAAGTIAMWPRKEVLKQGSTAFSEEKEAKRLLLS